MDRGLNNLLEKSSPAPRDRQDEGAIKDSHLGLLDGVRTNAVT